MAIYKIFPEKDATLYSAYPNKNTGLDSIIESSTTYIPDAPEVSRFLIKFSSTEIADIIDNKINGSVTDSTGSLLPTSKEFQSNLRCFISNINGLNTDTTLKIFPLAEPWNMGTGHYNDTPETQNGCSWKYRLSSGSGAWATSGWGAYITSSYPIANAGGGSWYTGSSTLNPVQSQVFNYSSDKDINVDVTNAIRLFNSGTISNEGFIVKQTDSDEFQTSTSKVTNIQYYSIDTNTIYPPQLEFKWRDYTFNTGSSSNSIIDNPQMVATLANNGRNFRRDSIQKFYINCRPQFPARVFQTSSLYTTNHYLPTASYYAIKDLDTNEFIINFDSDYTQISADSEGSYFKLYMNGLEPERYYQVLVKTTINGNTLILDDNYYFKVING
tara:strand:- start:799 stop:1953 length:1155 start_codon:yes stop_codon:yes gene_type:complete